MTGGVNSASFDTYVIVAGMSAPQPSHWIATARPAASAPTIVSGTKKRTLTFGGGSMRTTGLPAATHSPSR